jgi:hypothetical protein
MARIKGVLKSAEHVIKALGERGAEALPKVDEGLLDVLKVPEAPAAPKLTKKQREDQAKAEALRGVQGRRGLVEGKNVQPFINPSPEELATIRGEHGGFGSNLPEKVRAEQMKETYIDPDINAGIPEPGPRTREQKALPRKTVPVDSPRIADLIANPEVKRRIIEAAKAGEGVSGWYDTTPLQKMFHDEFGPEEGQRRFSDFIGFVAGTSTGNKIGPNIRTGSNYYAQKYGGGRDISQDPFVRGTDVQKKTGEGPEGESLYEPKYKDVPAAYEVPPDKYGSDKQQTHMFNVNNFAKGGGFDPYENPKIAAFYENLMGNWEPTTIDKHAMRLGAMASQDPRFLTDQGRAAFDDMTRAGLDQKAMMEQLGQRATNWTDIPDTDRGEYDALEKYWSDIAREMNITPAQLQAQAWVGGGAQTGLGSPGITFMDAFRDRVRRTALRDNISPDQVIKLMMHGRMTLAELEPHQTGNMPGASATG